MLALAMAGVSQGQIIVHLSSATNKAFEDYVKSAEAKMDWKAKTGGKRDSMDVVAWEGKSPRDVEDGLIHDWVAGTVIRGGKVDKALAVFQDYANYKKVFAPEVVDSRLLGHEGANWNTFLKLKRKAVMTLVLDSEYAVEYRALGGGRWGILSRSTKIAEMDGSKELPTGTGQGFLWRLNSYWLLEPRAEGLYLECRAISLSRDIPAGLGWIVKPVVAGVPRDSLQATLEEMKKALSR